MEIIANYQREKDAPQPAYIAPTYFRPPEQQPQNLQAIPVSAFSNGQVVQQPPPLPSTIKAAETSGNMINGRDRTEPPPIPPPETERRMNRRRSRSRARSCGTEQSEAPKKQQIGDKKYYLESVPGFTGLQHNFYSHRVEMRTYSDKGLNFRNATNPKDQR